MREIRTQVREEENSDSDCEEQEDFLNPYASQTEGYDSEDDYAHDKNNEFDISKINAVPTEEEKTTPIDDKLAEIILKNWKSEKPFDNMKKLFKKYPCPENCSLEPPKVNLELWKLLNSTQRKADVKLVGVQKSLKKALNVCMDILNNVQQENFSVHEMAQKTVDMAGILGHASKEISIKRRTFIRNVINPQYKDLCSATQPITTHLFGDDLPKLVKGLNLTNRIGNRSSVPSKGYHARSQGKSSYYSNTNKNHYKKQNSFLGRGRGNLPYQRYQSRRPKK